MARRSPVNVGLALALICVLSHGQANEVCRTGCRGASRTFKYNEGTTYKYNFDSKIQVSLSSAEGQLSTTEIRATVLLTQQPECNQVLRLQNVQVIGSDGKKHSNIPDIDKPIRINNHDGHLEDSICITSGDTQNSLNLKRAIASIFQANLKSGHETDVFGVCQTEVSQHKEGNVLVLQKSRNLNRCSYREIIKQDFLVTAYNPNSDLKSSPVLNGDYDAKLRIKNGILDQATVREQYLYVPFSVGNNGAKALIETTLKYAGNAKDNSPVQVSQPRSIIFEDPHPVHSPQTNVNSILTAVKQVAKSIDVVVGENTAHEFTNLVKILKVARKDDLLAVYNQVRAGVGFSDKVSAKKIFLDALLRAGNGDNIEVAIELLRNKELSLVEQNLVYFGLSTVRHATESSLNSAVNLFNQPNLPRSAYLGIGNLAGRFCRQHSCENVEAVNKLTQKLVQKLGNGKATNKEEENDIIYVLKALGNINHLSDNILGKITAIAQDRKAPNRVRVAALESYLADACKDKLRDSALGILKDIQQDSEVRIKAYLAVAGCPNNKVGNAIKALLEKEPSYQVGGFIVSHIRNLRSSANPNKDLAKQHLGNIRTARYFPFDLRKYSANTEFSYTIDSLGLANNVEADVIYSQNSFLPRSTNLKLGAELFGHDFNFLEIETRQENLDRLVEHYFGPRGLLRSNSLQELWNGKKEHANKILRTFTEKLDKSLRARRDVTKAEIDHIGKQVQIKTNDLNNDLDLDLSVKAFDSELLFLNLNDDCKKLTPDAIIDKIIAGLNQGLDKLKHFEETLRSNLLFLDAEFAYPTSSGFPLRLGVEGSANIQVLAGGSIDIRSLIHSPTSTVKISLIPSANVEVAGRLTVDALVVESGLKVISTLHTSAGGELNLQRDRENLDVKFSLPLEKQNIISATHNIVFHTREWGASEVNVPLKFAQNKDFSICLDQLGPFIGLVFCGEFTGPNVQGKNVPILPFPLSGDAKFAATIETEDLSYYHLKKASYRENKIGEELILAAIGKNGQEKLGLKLEAFAVPDKVIRASLSSPATSISAEARLVINPQEKSFSVIFLQDKNEYSGKIGVAVQSSGDKSVYKPIIQYKTPQDSALQIPTYRVEGEVIVEGVDPHTTFTLNNVRIIIPDQRTINLNGKFGREPEGIFSDLTLSDGSNTASFKGKLRVGPSIKYNAEFKNSVSPQGNLHITGELLKVADEVKNYFQLAHGGDFSDKNNILTLENDLKYRNRGPREFLLETKNKLTYPLWGTNLKLDFELKPNVVKYDVDIQYTNVKLGSELGWEQDNKPEGTDYKLEFGIWGLNNRLNLKSKRRVNAEHSQIENSLEINGKRAEVNGKIRHHVRPQDVDVAADLIIKVPTHNNPLHVVSGFKLNANELDASHKVTSGSTVFVDIFLKANRAGNANGSIKMNIKGELEIVGQVKANKGTGNGEIVIELPAFQRISKLETTFTIHEPKYNVLVNIYPIFNQDKSKKITLSTHTTATDHSLDTKNFVDVFGEKLEVNVKGSQQGQIDNGKTTGDIEIILPNQHYLSAKLNRDLRNSNGVLNGNVLGSLEHRPIKNQPGNKFTIKGQLKNTKPSDGIYDVNYQLSAERTTGQNINLDLGVKTESRGEEKSLELTTKIYGSDLASPIETTIRGNCRTTAGSYEVTSSYKPLGKATLIGKYDAAGQDKPQTGEISINLNANSKSLRTLRVLATGSALKTNVVDLKGKFEILADSPEDVIIELSTEGEVKASDKDTRIIGSVKSGKLDPIKIDTGISVGNKGEDQVQGDFTLQFGKNQHIKSDFNLVKPTPREYKLSAGLEIPSDKFKNNRIQVHTKRNEDKTHYQSEVTLTTDGKTWTSNTDLALSETAPSVDIKVTDPQGKLRHLLVKITSLSDTQLAGQLKIVNQPSNFLLEGTVDARVESIDDFNVKVTANSPALKIEKYVIEAHNKPAKTGRRIQVTAKSGNKNILAGSTSYTAREEHGKLIVEGSGSFKVHDQTKSANFKYIRQNLSIAKNGESGIEISFDAGLGNQALDAELKVTNKQFRILNSYCEEKKQCAHVEVDVKVSSDDIKYFNQEIEVTVDLRKLGLPHEFGLKASTTRRDYVLDHTVDIHFQSQENSKYQYSLYLHPKEAGVSLTTPRRKVSLEANVKCPPNVLKDGGRLSGELVMYADKKNQPNQKSGIIAFLDLNIKGQSLNGEARFTNPALRRPLVVSVQSKTLPGAYDLVVIADVFAQPDQKVIITYKWKWTDVKNYKKFEVSDAFGIKSSGLGFDMLYDEWIAYSIDDGILKVGAKLDYQGQRNKYASAATYESTPKSLQIVFDLFNVHIFKLVSRLQISGNNQVIESEITHIGRKPLVSHLELKNHNTLTFTLARKDRPQDKLQINSGFIPGQIADFRAEIYKNGAPHELGHATVKLDDANFLKSDYNLQHRNLEDLLFHPMRKELEADGEELKELSKKVTQELQGEFNHLGEVTHRATPNLKPLADYYTGELKKVKDEILADKTIKDVSEFLYNIVSAITQAVGETVGHFSQLVENIVRNLQNTFGRVLQAIEKDLLPKAKELGDKLLGFVFQITNISINIVMTIGAKIAETAEKFKPELQQLAAVTGEITQDLFKAVHDVYQAILDVLADQWNQIYNEIKSLPIVQQWREEYNKFIQHGLPTSEVLANGIKDLLSTLKDLAPTVELKELVQAISDYITGALSNKPINDKAATDRIIKAAVASMNQIVETFVRGDPTPDMQGVRLPVPTNIWNSLPRLAAVKLSPLSYILGDELNADPGFLLSLVNKPRNWIPPFPLYGLIAQGQHIFTFDGKHLTFPGNCNYLLARDAVDGNFTIVGTYKEGLLEAISLTVGSDTITLKKHGIVTVNKAQSELPARASGVAAYRNAEAIYLVSKGIVVTCGPELVVCGVQASGFYHGKVKGLLGNGNNEPYDDFTLPNGKIVASESDFGNSYKTTSGCAAVQTVSHHEHHSSPSCDELFSRESSLSLCYPFIGTGNFRMACEHGVAAGVKDTEFAIAIAYVGACAHHNIPIRVPSKFLKCTNGDKPTAVGDVFSETVPSQAADIVVLVDTSKENEATYKELVQPLIQQLTSELTNKGISNVDFHIIAYGGENKWPTHITTGGGKLNFKGKAPNLKFTDGRQNEVLITGCPHLDILISTIQTTSRDLKLAFGLDLQALTYNEGLQYPFRANAVKSIIAVTSKPCQVGRFFPLQLLRTLLYRGKDVSLNLITPISRSGAKAEAKNIVGFNSRNVFALGPTKNKIKHFSDLGKELTYSDYCIDFTVQNDGNVFVADHVHLQPKGQRRQFVQVTSHAIVEQLLSSERTYECKCEYYSPYSVANVCRLTSSKDKAQGKKVGTKS